VTDELADQLAGLLGAARIESITRLSGGASRETFRFVADGRPLILQRQRSGDVRDMGVEAAVLTAAAAHDVPVPGLVASGGGDGPLGAAFIVMEAVEGETIARKILRDERFAAARPMLAGQLGRAAAAIHRIPLADLPALPDVDQIEQYRSTLDALGHPHPTFEAAFQWLQLHRPAPSEPTLVHGDLRMGNVIVGDDGLRAVLDWELAHVGDPMEDLGWMCVRAWRFGSERPVAGVGDYLELLDAYAAASGTSVDADVVHWWEVLGTVKWGIMCMLQANAHLSGAARSHELAAIGRRVCENEYDVLSALEGRW
jgi:aminoglycoside phosphotransferase (APT) family kinase protein